MAAIEFTEWTSANHLRHPKFIGLRDDRDAKEIVREAFEVETLSDVWKIHFNLG